MSTDSFPITAAQLVGNYCETLTFGIYLVTCCFCARTLLFTSGPQERLRKRHEIRWLMLSVAVIFFVVSVYDDVIGLIHNLKAFAWYDGPGGASHELTNIHDWINISRSAAQMVNMILADFVLIYRCYIVYARRWSVIVPSSILYLAGLAVAIMLCVVEGVTSNYAITLNSSIIKPWSCAFFAITAAQNILTTSLLVWRIWRVECQVVKYRASVIRSVSIPTYQTPLRKVICVIAESGAAYTTMVFMAFVASVCTSNALYPLGDATLQATGITFNVIIIRTSPCRDEQFTNFDINERPMAEQGRGKPTSSIHFLSGGIIDDSTTTQSNTIDHVNVEISKTVRTDGELQTEAEELGMNERDTASVPA